MLELDNISLEKLSVHFIGNRSREEGTVLSKKAQNRFEPEEEQVLWKLFLSPFKNTSEFYRFAHSSDIDLNEIRKFASECFEEPSKLHKVSEKIAKLLYEKSTHSKINAGELYVVYMSSCVLEDKEVNAIGIFKSETKDSFLQAVPEEGNILLRFQTGISKLEKGCLILDVGGKEEYKICITGGSGNSSETVYWKDDFLQIQPCADDFHNTKNFMNVCKTFVTDRLDEDFEISKTDKIAFLNKSVDYFKQNETFNEQEFAKEVFEDKNVIKSFREYKNEYQESNNIDIEEDFEISAPAVKKQAKVFKSVLKLDKNFHIYIHGAQQYIEKGVEKDGRKFYKIYYNEEK